jgi:hypothetical protein
MCEVILYSIPRKRGVRASAVREIKAAKIFIAINVNY